MDRVIVSRHPAAVKFIARELGGYVCQSDARIPGIDGVQLVRDGIAEQEIVIPVLASATTDDVRGKVVYGNLPLHLAALAAEVHAIEFPDYHHERDASGNITRAYVAGSAAPRGSEYTLADMDAAGARLTVYCVHAGDRSSLYNAYRGAV